MIRRTARWIASNELLWLQWALVIPAVWAPAVVLFPGSLWQFPLVFVGSGAVTYTIGMLMIGRE